MRRGNLPRNQECKKLYPVCSWEKNQHKLYNAHDRIYVAWKEGECEYSELEKIERAMWVFDSHVIDGIVYATWEDGLIIKDYVWAYNARH